MVMEGGGSGSVDEDVKKMEMGSSPASAAVAHDHVQRPVGSSAVSPIVINLLVRIATAVFLLIALIVIAAAKGNFYLDFNIYESGAKDVYAYRYLISVIVIGLAYTLLQIAFTTYRLLMKKRLGANDNTMILFDFYADKVLSYFLATGSAAGFGGSVDSKEFFANYGFGGGSLYNAGNAASSLVLIAFVFSAASSVLSSYALSNKPS